MLIAHAAGEAAAPTAGGGLLSMVPFLLIWGAIFYFLLIRPQKKRQKAMMNMLDALQVGDKVVTTGGVMGKILKIKEDSVVIETGSAGNKSEIKFEKNSIARVLTIHE